MKTEFTKSKELGELDTLLTIIYKKYNLSPSEIFFIIANKKFIPSNIFIKELSPLETIAKYLIENLNFSVKDAGTLLKRSQKTIWQAYNHSKKKFVKRLEVKNPKYLLPIDLLGNRKFSVFELIVSYVIEFYKLKNGQAALLLKRDPRTIWTVYHRYLKKK